MVDNRSEWEVARFFGIHRKTAVSGLTRYCPASCPITRGMILSSNLEFSMRTYTTEGAVSII